MIETSSVLRAGIVKRIHVDQKRIKANLRDGTDLPPLTVQALGGPYKAHEVEIYGLSRMVYDGTVLSCGARVWLETMGEVKTIVRERLGPCCEPDIEDAPPA